MILPGRIYPFGLAVSTSVRACIGVRGHSRVNTSQILRWKVISLMIGRAFFSDECCICLEIILVLYLSKMQKKMHLLHF